MESSEKEKQSIPPDNENVSEGKKMIKAANVANPPSTEEEDNKEKDDAANWRNEG